MGTGKGEHGLLGGKSQGEHKVLERGEPEARSLDGGEHGTRNGNGESMLTGEGEQQEGEAGGGKEIFFPEIEWGMLYGGNY